MHVRARPIGTLSPVPSALNVNSKSPPAITNFLLIDI